MSLKIYLNGKILPQEDAKISVFDHGLLYGDGVFEGIRAYNGKIFMLQQHMDRLYDSAKAIALKIPITKDEMAEAIKKTMAANNLTDSYIRLVVTRGVGKLGLDPNKCAVPQIIIITDTIELYSKALYERGLDIVTVTTIRNHFSALDPKIKSLNYLNNILAKLESIEAGAGEALMLNKDGYVAECAGDNIFILKDNILLTPPPSAGILIGITRNVVMELAVKMGVQAKECLMTRYDVYIADECFLTGTAAEIIPVVKIDGRIIGNGKPGKVTLELLKWYRDQTRNGY
ncbi:MAG: branched-chain-amino-acid transaminase [Planctomycetia bacterium]|uniref:Branched-chain-amino-acid aminotransferase n=1 Tax=Candidatus Brocadia sapporoensis TaxID=392547 RepID=A0A1V6LY14_9BACT|nr:branched-chain-amino-acid transaminase [Candidatus Brocadia sapporoensis]MCC7238004.1 branched-chain-amino-acid transaminase [Candidatus Brocadia sp.]QOJ07029.1 MAG: branched-chain-amino-acid transaminase [Planctomycetia bacterium]TVL96219.1 MAG: branched-chain-amino-acid transaminase [Candidatus Brocadia sp. BL1]MDG6005324.1 branched-chain-amino-acid transaminase [Candidatus Brocadia sp.]OQD45021.1 branched-chain-amino-acid transaminase [Candidatus Brocadia sapporoensis]